MKLLLFLIIIMLFTSCYVTKYKPLDPLLDEYLNQTEHDIVMKLGPANSSTSDGAGGKILNYEEISYITLEKLYPADYTAKSVTVTNKYYVQFYINADSKVYFHRSNVLVPYREEDKSATQGLVVVLILGVMALFILVAHG